VVVVEVLVDVVLVVVEVLVDVVLVVVVGATVVVVVGVVVVVVVVVVGVVVVRAGAEVGAASATDSLEPLQADIVMPASATNAVTVRTLRGIPRPVIDSIMSELIGFGDRFLDSGGGPLGTADAGRDADPVIAGAGQGDRGRQGRFELGDQAVVIRAVLRERLDPARQRRLTWLEIESEVVPGLVDRGGEGRIVIEVFDRETVASERYTQDL
jgi:hypothetical protein